MCFKKSCKTKHNNRMCDVRIIFRKMTCSSQTEFLQNTEVVPQLAERSLQSPQARGSIPVISKIL